MAVDPLIKKLFLDILLVSCVFLTTALLHGFCKPYRRGYFADDETIRLPYKPDSIPYWVLAVSTSAFIGVTICITEIVRYRQDLSKKKYIFRCAVPKWLWESFIVCGTYAFGMASQQLFVEVSKLAGGRLRPHFIAECKPVPIGTPGPHEYITNYNCTLRDRPNLRKSFPSGHSSTAMYAAVFAIIYIQNRIYYQGSKMLRHIFQLIVLCLAWYVCLTRISDHMHHWEDVAIGILVGMVFAILTWIYVFKTTKLDPPDVIIEDLEIQLRPKVSPILH
ncbi:PAP2 superfamily domain-containing protein [Phthorimaea operculella]|nr:PAP2 superfamily domain-containing protein [Phthorimaea operculella]